MSGTTIFLAVLGAVILSAVNCFWRLAVNIQKLELTDSQFDRFFLATMQERRAVLAHLVDGELNHPLVRSVFGLDEPKSPF